MDNIFSNIKEREKKKKKYKEIPSERMANHLVNPVGQKSFQICSQIYA
jgi:hypothetical protein